MPNATNMREHSPENRGPLTCQCEHANHFEYKTATGRSALHCSHPYGETFAPDFLSTVRTAYGDFQMCATCAEQYTASPAPLLTEHSPARMDEIDLTPNYDALFDRFSREIVAQPLLDLIQHDTDALRHFNALMAALDITIMSAHTTAQLAVVRHKVHAALGKASAAYQAALADDDAREEATEL